MYQKPKCTTHKDTRFFAVRTVIGSLLAAVIDMTMVIPVGDGTALPDEITLCVSDTSPGGPREAQEGPRKPQEAPRRLRKAPGEPRKASGGPRKP